MIHIFYECADIQSLIDHYFIMCARVGEHNRSIEDFIFNTIFEKANHILNFVAIFLKQYIYRKKCMNQKPNIAQFTVLLEVHQNAEFCIARNKGTLRKFYQRWNPICYIFDDEYYQSD